MATECKQIAIDLNGEWALSFTLPGEDRIVTGTAPVPGNVEPVLVKMGLIDDYMPADNADATTVFGAVDDWCYTTHFDGKPEKAGWTRQLVLEGIDTLAQVYLNGEQICECINMHYTYRIDVTGKLKTTDNELKIVIRSCELWARAHQHDMFVTAHGVNSYYDAQTYLRKARHQWGWDNAPRLITSGIIRPVYVEDIPPCRFDEVYLYTADLTEEHAVIGANWVYQTPDKVMTGHQIRLTLSDEGQIVYENTQKAWFVQGAMKCSIPRKAIQLWWPNGFGEPKLYTLKLEMLKNEECVAVYQAPFGIRTLGLVYTEEVQADGTGEFVFRVNGEKVFIRGTNWKPLDPLASRADEKTRSLRALNEIKNLNCNMVRIWGGGIYEDPVFFDYCDRNGIMVWHDFMVACEIPATDEAYCRAVAEEARQIIRKYRNHPSLATWCGDNENDECMTWVNQRSTILPSQSLITRKILKEAVLHFDPYRTYVPSSPIMSDRHYLERLNGNMTHFQPETHLYPNTVHFSEALRNCKSFFIGETGPIKVNAITVNPWIFEREQERARRLWDSPRLPSTDSHQNDGYFTYWRNAGKEVCLSNFGRDFSFEEWKDYTLAINVICAEVFKDVIEYCRVKRWEKTGVIWWSLTDMWPMLFNYSVSDCEGNRKLPYYWIRQSQQEMALMAVRTEIGGELALYAANDTRTSHTVEYTVTAYDEGGTGRTIASGICRQPANSSTLIQRIAENDRPELWIIRWQENGKTYTNHVFTGKTTYETMRKWVRIIGEQGEFAEEIRELKQLDE